MHSRVARSNILLLNTMGARVRVVAPSTLLPMGIERMKPPQQGFFTLGANTYQLNSFPIDINEENIGLLSIGDRFDLSEFSTPTVLAQNGKILRSSVPDASSAELESALRGCGDQAECETKIAGEIYMTLAADTIQFGDGYTLRSLQSVDSISRPVQDVVREVFLVATLGALAAAAALSLFSSRSIVRPIAGVVSSLRQSEATGTLPSFESNPATIHEIRELIRGLAGERTTNFAARSDRQRKDRNLFASNPGCARTRAQRDRPRARNFAYTADGRTFQGSLCRSAGCGRSIAQPFIRRRTPR